MRRKLIAGNWKMNCLKQEAIALSGQISNFYARLQNPSFDMFIAPPFTMLDTVVKIVGASGVVVAAQDCSVYDFGAHTGDISPSMIKDLGCKGVIIGHSERRINHNEISEDVHTKAVAALQTGLKVIICVGETLRERTIGKTLEVVSDQIKASVPLDAETGQIVIAYEPVWAIGTGRTPTPEEVQKVHAFIRDVLGGLFGQATASAIQILYGGSVKPDNASLLLSLPDVDGALIGGASLKAEEFSAIAQTLK